MLTLIQSYFSVLMLFGASQAVTGIYLLIKEKERPFYNNLLALLLFAWGFSCYWFFAFIHKGYFFSVEVTTFIGPMLALTLFPPVYLFVKYLFYDFRKFQSKIHLHLLPIYIYIGFTLYLFFDSDFSIDAMRNHEWYRLRNLACSYVATFQGPFYFIKTNYILKLRQQTLKEEFSEIESRKLRDFQIIHYSFALVFIIGGISTIFKIAFLDPFALYMAYHAVLAVSLFYINLMIYKYPNVFAPFKPTLSHLSPNLHDVVSEDQFHLPKTHLAEKNGNNKQQEIIAKIDQLMKEQKPFKNPNFSLNDLAQSISESRNSISYVLNNNLKKSFYNYINELRIAESKRLLSDRGLHNLTIEGIAAESGFKTMSVFYRFFKDTEKITPAIYRKKMLSQSPEK